MESCTNTLIFQHAKDQKDDYHDLSQWGYNGLEGMTYAPNNLNHTLGLHLIYESSSIAVLRKYIRGLKMLKPNNLKMKKWCGICKKHGWDVGRIFDKEGNHKTE